MGKKFVMIFQSKSHCEISIIVREVQENSQNSPGKYFICLQNITNLETNTSRILGI